MLDNMRSGTWQQRARAPAAHLVIGRMASRIQANSFETIQT